MMSQADFITAQAYAVFVSDMSCHAEVTDAVTTAAIQRAMHAFGGTRGCTAAAASEYGEHPDTASERVRWARNVVTALYGSAPHLAQAPHGAKKTRLFGIASTSLAAHQS